MSGHSKWSQIKRLKAVKDARKGASFAKLSRDIQIAAKLGGPDPTGNFRLRTAIEKAKEAAMPNDNIKRAIEKGAGNGEADQLESLVYEGYGPGGVALYIEAMTDNRNRTAGDIRSYFNKYQGNLGAEGSVAWMFEEKGLIVVSLAQYTLDTVLEIAINAGALDIAELPETGQAEIICAPAELNAICQALQSAGLVVVSAESIRDCATQIIIEDTLQAKPLIKLLEALDAHDDIQQVFANVQWSDALLSQRDL